MMNYMIILDTVKTIVTLTSFTVAGVSFITFMDLINNYYERL